MFDPAFTFFSGIGLVLVLLPVPLQWKARNAGTLLNLGWLFVSNLFYFVNSILWRDNNLNIAPVWCDISVKVHTAMLTGIAASSLCINRRLAAIASSRSVVLNHREKRKSTWIDLGIGIGIPLLVMVFSYIFQPHRFDITEGIGCEAVTWHCVGSIVLVSAAPVVLGTVSAIFGGYSASFFVIRRAQVKSLLHSSSSALDSSHYLRLMALASTDILLGLPMSCFTLQQNVSVLKPWVSWSYVHANWSRVVTRSDEQILFSASITTFHYLPRWFMPLMSIIAFLYFGVGDDALREYWRWWVWVADRLKLNKKAQYASAPPPQLNLGSAVCNASGSRWNTWSPEQDGYSFAPGRWSDEAERAEGLKVAVTVERETV